MKDQAEPLELLVTTVKKEWLDYNAHFNAGFYAVAYNLAIERFLENIGLGLDLVQRGVGTTFALECHLTYQKELREDDPIRITLQLLDYDKKRIHFFLRMYHTEQNTLASTCEQISIFVDLATRRTASLPDAAISKLRRMYEVHGDWQKPAEMGRVIGIRTT